MKEAEQERQWKALQATRAREQQMGMPPDSRMLHMSGNFITKYRPFRVNFALTNVFFS